MNTARAGDRARALRRGAAALLVVLACGLVAALLLFADLRTAQRDVQARARLLGQQLAARLDSEQALLHAMAGLYHSRLVFSDDEFSDYAHEVIAAYPFIHRLTLVERVDDGQRDAFETRMLEQGYPGLRIADGSTFDGAYLVTKMVEPLGPASARMIGHDLLSIEGILPSIEQAVSSAEVQGFGALAMADGDSGFLLLKALYKGRVVPSSPEQRHRQLAGLLVLYNDGTRLLGGLGDDDPTLALRLDMLDSTGQSAGRPAFERPTNRPDGSDAWFPIGYQHRFDAMGQDLQLSAQWSPGVAIFDLNRLVPLLWLTALLGAATVFVWENRRTTRLREDAARLAVAAEKERAEVTLHSIGDAVVRIDLGGRVEFLNPMAERLTGVAAADATGRPLSQLLSIVDEESGDPLLQDIIGQQSVDPAAVELPAAAANGGNRSALLLRTDGESVAIDETITPLRDRHGAISGAVLVFRDVGVERRLNCQLSYQATHDALTDLINRQEFERLVSASVAQARGEQAHHALFYMDLDQFKVVNDTCGHAAGDLLLKQVSNLLQQHIRVHDTLARLGGDEFGVLLRDCPLQRATAIAEDMRHEIRAYRFHWQEQTFDIRVSIGVVPIDAGTSDLTEVLSAADSACYVAKDKGRDLVHVSEPDDRAMARRHGEMQWLQRVQNALQDGRLELRCQRMLRLNPDCQKAEVIEFLLRMRSGHGELVSPMAFLPAAERYNMMADIDRWVVDRALAEIAAANQNPGPDRPSRLYTINLSGQSLGDPNTTRHILDRLEHASVPPDDLCFEITETSAIANLNEATHLISELQKRGCAFALDDFGSGLSSFGYLKKLRVNYLKIDGAFVRDMVSDRVDAAMVASIHNIGRVLGICTIAEFVEDQETLDRLREMGVDYAQGYHIHRPSPLEDAI